VLHKCANPACPNLFRSLSHGKLFLVETDNPAAAALVARKERSGRRTERYWLCDGCSSLLTLTIERGRGIVAVSLPDKSTFVPARI
jgi:hypothetical protein